MIALFSGVISFSICVFIFYTIELLYRYGYIWYFRKLTFDQKALIDKNPGLLIFIDNNLQKEIYIDTKYISNYLGIKQTHSYWYIRSFGDIKLNSLLETFLRTIYSPRWWPPLHKFNGIIPVQRHPLLSSKPDLMHIYGNYKYW